MQIAKTSYTNYDPKADINGSVAGERSQVNSQAFQYQQRVDNPFAYGVGKGLLKLSPLGLVAGAGYGAYTITSAILENGLEATAISIAKGIVDLPYEIKARLNSNDPTVRGEALVDVIAFGSSTAYLTQKLGLAGVNTADQAIAKAVAKAAEAKRVMTSEGAANAAGYAELKLDLKTTEAANGVVESLRTTGQLPSSYVTKGQAYQQGWQEGKAINNYVPGGQIINCQHYRSRLGSSGEWGNRLNIRRCSCGIECRCE